MQGLIALCLVTVVADAAAKNEEACLLQQSSISRPLGRGLDEDVTPPRQAQTPEEIDETFDDPDVPAVRSAHAPRHAGIDLDQDTHPSQSARAPKRLPKGSARLERLRKELDRTIKKAVTSSVRAPKSAPLQPDRDADKDRLSSQSVREASKRPKRKKPSDGGKSPPDFGDDPKLSMLVEMRLKSGLQDIAAGQGSLTKFGDAFQSQVSSAMGIDPKRLQINGISGGYMETDKASLSQYGEGTTEDGSQVHFEVLAGEPSAGKSASKLASEVGSNHMEGSLGNVLNGAGVVATPGSKAGSDPSQTWRQQEAGQPLEVTEDGGTMKVMLPWLVVVLLFVFAVLAMCFWVKSFQKK